MDIPEASQPSLSGYVQSAKKLLPWKWVDARMAQARNYWVTTHAKGFPSCRPVWGIWQSPVLIFSTGSQISRNIQKNPSLQVNLESGDELVIIEGEARQLDSSAVDDWVRCYREKYHWDMPANNIGVWEVVPYRVLAWISDSSGLDDGVSFNNSATEWIFPN